MERVVYRTCTLCEASCGIEVHLDGETITTIRGDALDPLGQGHICPKARALKDLHEDPDRLRQPMRRNRNGWEALSWEAALACAVDGITAVQRKHGNDSVALYQGEPVTHNLGALLFGDLLFAALATSKRFSANSLDQFPKQLVCHLIYGSGFFVPVPDVDRTSHMLIIGANPVVSNGSLMTAPGMRERLRGIQQRGGKIVVLDPCRTETARLADAHHFIRPGTDTLFLAALIQCLFAEDRIALGRLQPMADGLDLVRQAVSPFTPEAVAQTVGIASATIREIARDFAASAPAVCYGRMGVSTVPFGTTANWLIDVLNIVTGNLDRPGGAMFPQPSVDVLKLQPPTERGRWQSRTRGTLEFMGELPAATLAEEIETAGKGQLRGLVTLAGNPVLSSPAGHRLSEALGKLDFMVSIDLYLNETTRHADVILPPVGPLERDHFDVAFQLFQVRDTTRWSPAVFTAPAGAKNDGDILLELAHHLFRARGGADRLKALPLRALLALGADRFARLALDLSLRFGPYGSGLRPWRQGVTLNQLRRSPHGIDLGPLRPCLPKRLPRREKGRPPAIDLAPHDLVDDLQRLRRKLRTETPHPKNGPPSAAPPAHPELVEGWAAPLRHSSARADARNPKSPLLPGEGQIEVMRSFDPLTSILSLGERRNTREDAHLLLIGRRELRTVNSWSHNLPSLVSGRPRCLLYMHPEDAAARGIRANDFVRVSSRVGTVEVPTEITEDVMPGVVSLPHGYGHGGAGMRLSVAAQHAGVSMNDLTDPAEIDPLSGNAVLSGVPVLVEPCDRRTPSM